MRSPLPANAMRMIASIGDFAASAIASYATAWPTETCGSRNVACSAAITMSASATKCSPPPAHTPLTAAITGFHTSLCHAVNCSSKRLRAAALLAQRVGIASQLHDVQPGLERLAGAGVHDHPHVGIGDRARATRPRARRSISASIALPASGRLKISQPTPSRCSTISVS